MDHGTFDSFTRSRIGTYLREHDPPRHHPAPERSRPRGTPRAAGAGGGRGHVQEEVRPL